MDSVDYHVAMDYKHRCHLKSGAADLRDYTNPTDCYRHMDRPDFPDRPGYKDLTDHYYHKDHQGFHPGTARHRQVPASVEPRPVGCAPNPGKDWKAVAVAAIAAVGRYNYPNRRVDSTDLGFLQGHLERLVD